MILRSVRALGAVAAALLAMAGCAAVGSTTSAETDKPTAVLAAEKTVGVAATQPEDTTEFWYQLARRPVATNDAALHAILLYADGQDASDTYDARVSSLKSRGLLPNDFNAAASAPLHRGTLAYSIVKTLGIHGGVTMRVLGTSTRYATKALEARQLFPPGSENQPFSGAQFVGVMGKIEDYQRGDAALKPAYLMPGEQTLPPIDVLAPLEAFEDDTPRPIKPDEVAHEVFPAAHPLLLMSVGDTVKANADTQPATAPTAADQGPIKLQGIVTGVEGDAQVRRSEDQPWEPAKVGMKVSEAAEFRTGAKSAVRFFIKPNHCFCVDRQSDVKVLAAYRDRTKIKTDVGLEQGRVRAAIERLPATPAQPSQTPAGAPVTPAGDLYQVEEQGLERECTIHSPNTALSVRGTMVSLYDQPPFAPEAVSLTGRAIFENVRRERVAFGSSRRRTAKVSGDNTSAAEHAEENASVPTNSPSSRNDFETQEIARVVSRGGFVVGDVLVGDSSGVPSSLPGDLNFILTWDGGPQRALNDLNLVVKSPVDKNQSDGKGGSFRDYVGNPPFSFSLDTNSAEGKRIRETSSLVPPSDPDNPIVIYPRTSRTGGRIGLNHIGPEGREVASWSGQYPTSATVPYEVDVYHTLDLQKIPGNKPPTATGQPVTYSVEVLQRTGPGKGTSAFTTIKEFKMQTINQFDTQTFNVIVPAAPPPVSTSRTRGR